MFIGSCIEPQYKNVYLVLLYIYIFCGQYLSSYLSICVYHRPIPCWSAEQRDAPCWKFIDFPTVKITCWYVAQLWQFVPPSACHCIICRPLQFFFAISFFLGVPEKAISSNALNESTVHWETKKMFVLATGAGKHLLGRAAARGKSEEHGCFSLTNLSGETSE